MERKLQRIIMDLEDFSEDRSLDRDSRKAIEKIILKLKELNPYSTDL